jgi:hypothetical protein
MSSRPRLSSTLCRALLTVSCVAMAWSGLLAVSPPARADTVSVVALTYGDLNDVPITGDWNGSGKAQIGVYRPSNRTFYLGDVGGDSYAALTYGDLNDVPITGDWNGSGKAQIGVYRPSNRTFYLGDVGGDSYAALTYGDLNDVPITGDWNGSGKAQIGVYRPSNGTFYLGDVNGLAPTAIHFGDSGDVPITGDWNGSGKTQIGVYRPSNRTFYLREVTPPAPPPPPPVVTAPVTVPLPTPARGTRRHPRVRVTIRISWTYNRARTRIHRVQMSRVPRGARITVRCTGRGCPVKQRTARARHLRGLERRLAGSLYRAGDLILITIAAPGHVSERALVKIRNGRLPVAALL